MSGRVGGEKRRNRGSSEALKLYDGERELTKLRTTAMNRIKARGENLYSAMAATEDDEEEESDDQCNSDY